MGTLQYHGVLFIHPSVYRVTQSHMLRFNFQSLPGEIYNDTVAIAVGREFGHLSHPPVFFLTLWDRKPGGNTQTNHHALSGGEQYGFHQDQ